MRDPFGSDGGTDPPPPDTHIPMNLRVRSLFQSTSLLAVAFHGTNIYALSLLPSKNKLCLFAHPYEICTSLLPSLLMEVLPKFKFSFYGADFIVDKFDLWLIV